MNKRIILLSVASVLVLMTSTAVFAQRSVAKLSTKGGPVIVNGANATSGASLLTGATIETPAAVSGTIDLGAMGTVELKRNSAIQLDFDSDGNVRVKLIQGCTVVTRKASSQGVGEVFISKGASEKTSSKRRKLSFCIQSNGTLSAIGPRL